MVAAQDKVNQSQRQAAIESQVAKYKNAGTKRNLGHNMRLAGKIEDLEELFKTEEAGADFVTSENIKAANETIQKAVSLIKILKGDVQHEIDMQIVAATSDCQNFRRWPGTS